MACILMHSAGGVQKCAPPASSLALLDVFARIIYNKRCLNPPLKGAVNDQVGLLSGGLPILKVAEQDVETTYLTLRHGSAFATIPARKSKYVE